MQVEGPIAGEPEGPAWLAFLRKTALGLGVALLASALVCWVAANWPYASAAQKIIGLQALLALVVAAACLRARHAPAGANPNFTLSAQLAGLGGVLVGALLALVGQIYQTGADTWQLFFWWAMLLAPWVLVARTVFLGLLWVGIANLAFWLWLDGHAGFLGWPDGGGVVFGLIGVLCNALLLLAWELSQARLRDDWRIGPRLLLMGVLSWLFWMQMAAHDAGAGTAIVVLLGSVALLGGLAFWYARRRFDLAMLCMLGLHLLALITFETIVRLDSELVLLPLILVLMALTAVMLAGLRRLRARHTMADASGDPWYFSGFRTSATWLLALLLVAFLLLVLEFSIDHATWAGVVLLLGGMLALRGIPGPALREVGASLATAGVLLLCAAFFDMGPQGNAWEALAVLVLGVAAYAGGNHPSFRFFTAVIVIGLLLFLTWNEDWSRTLALVEDASGRPPAEWLSAVYARLWLLVVGAVLCLALARDAARADIWLPLAWALALSVQVLAWAAPSHWGMPQGQSGFALFNAHLLRTAFALLPAVLLAAFWLRLAPGAPSRQVRVLAVLALVVAGFGWLGAPGIVLGLAWLILGFGQARRTWLVFGVLGLLVYLARFYYDLDISLLNKAGVLAAMGLWFLAGGLALAEPRAKGDACDARRLLVGLPVALVLALGVVNLDILRKETILREGHRVILALAPVDPRSLMQGDYMALRFEAADEARRWLQDDAVAPQGDGFLRLVADPEGVHRVAGVQEGAAVSPGSIPMRFRQRDGRVIVGVNAYFFPEGQAERFALARYGEFRVSDSGSPLLVRLLDGQLQPL